MSPVFTPTRPKLSVDDYHNLGEAGILDEDSRVELIEGELIDMAPIGALHMMTVNRLTRLLVGAVGVVSIQNPVTVPPHSEPQPDINSPATGTPGCRDPQMSCFWTRGKDRKRTIVSPVGSASKTIHALLVPSQTHQLPEG
jgi:hypothetical protein